MKQTVYLDVAARLGILAIAASSVVQCATPSSHEREQEQIPMTASKPTPTEKEQQTAATKKTTAAPAKGTAERGEIAAKYKWNTAHLFASDAAWEKERAGVVAAFKGITECKGKLKRGKRMVRTCLERLFQTRKRLDRLANYSHRLYDQDTRVAKYQGYKEVVDKVATDYMEVISFVQPELLALPAATLRALIKDKEFADYSQYLRDILRLKPHILTPLEEKLLASASLMRDTGYNTYSAFSGADLKFPTIRDESGEEVQLSQSLFTRYRTSESQRVRKDTFEAFFGTYKEYRNTLASLLSAQINSNIVYARARKYKTALDAALDGGNIPVAVYHNMIKAVNKHLPTLHRYLKLRQRLLGLKELRYYDMYPSIIKKVELKYNYDESRALLVRALDPMGKEYVAALDQGLAPQSGWVDVYPNKGKRSGAYMDGSAFDVHPYVLCNHLDDYNSVSTLAHEMGHAMHSFFSNKNQPFPKADYSIFVAEVASTLNEALLMHHMLAQVEDPKKRLFLLGEQLEDFRQTVFRQAMFAEFELRLYERAERKEALTAEQISKIYLEIARRYYGHDQKVVLIDELYGMEWAYVPHFYYNFYVYQYVTGMTAAVALSEMVLDPKGGTAARERYVKHMLKAGGSDYPIVLLKRAGVDLTTVAPYDIAMRVFSRTLEQAEKLVKSLDKQPK
jgi:oligoendopeptidase F